MLLKLLIPNFKKCFSSKLKRCRPTPRSLYFAAKQGNALQVLVLAAGCNVNATIPQEKHKTAMHAASAAGHVDVLRLLCMVSIRNLIPVLTPPNTSDNCTLVNMSDVSTEGPFLLEASNHPLSTLFKY